MRKNLISAVVVLELFNCSMIWGMRITKPRGGECEAFSKYKHIAQLNNASGKKCRNNIFDVGGEDEAEPLSTELCTLVSDDIGPNDQFTNASIQTGGLKKTVNVNCDVLFGCNNNNDSCMCTFNPETSKQHKKIGNVTKTLNSYDGDEYYGNNIFNLVKFDSEINTSVACNLISKLNNVQGNNAKKTTLTDRCITSDGKSKIMEIKISFNKGGKAKNGNTNYDNNNPRTNMCDDKTIYNKPSAAITKTNKELLTIEKKKKVLLLNFNKGGIYAKKLPNLKMNTITPKTEIMGNNNIVSVGGIYKKETVTAGNSCHFQKKKVRKLSDAECFDNESPKYLAKMAKESNEKKDFFAQWIKKLEKANERYEIVDCLKELSRLGKEQPQLWETISGIWNKWNNNQSSRNKYKEAKNTKNEILELLSKDTNEKTKQVSISAQS